MTVDSQNISLSGVFTLPPGTRGDILCYDGSAWIVLNKGTSGKFLQIGANDPSWQSQSTIATDLNITSQAAGDLLYFNGTNWVRLAKGTALQQLRMNAGDTAPEWATITSGNKVKVLATGNHSRGGNDTPTLAQAVSISASDLSATDCIVIDLEVTTGASAYFMRVQLVGDSTLTGNDLLFTASLSTKGRWVIRQNTDTTTQARIFEEVVNGTSTITIINGALSSSGNCMAQAFTLNLIDFVGSVGGYAAAKAYWTVTRLAAG
jgi:hypothetical protein